MLKSILWTHIVSMTGIGPAVKTLHTGTLSLLLSLFWGENACFLAACHFSLDLSLAIPRGDYLV